MNSPEEKLALLQQTHCTECGFYHECVGNGEKSTLAHAQVFEFVQKKCLLRDGGNNFSCAHIDTFKSDAHRLLLQLIDGSQDEALYKNARHIISLLDLLRRRFELGTLGVLPEIIGLDNSLADIVCKAENIREYFVRAEADDYDGDKYAYRVFLEQTLKGFQVTIADEIMLPIRQRAIKQLQEEVSEDTKHLTA